MFTQTVVVSEPLPTLRADVWAHVEVHVHVLAQTLCDSEKATALCTLVWLIAGMVAHVSSMLLRHHERLVTQLTRERTLARVSTSMGVQIVDTREAFAANVARVRPFTGVRANMHV